MNLNLVFVLITLLLSLSIECFQYKLLSSLQSKRHLQHSIRCLLRMSDNQVNPDSSNEVDKNRPPIIPFDASDFIRADAKLPSPLQPESPIITRESPLMGRPTPTPSSSSSRTNSRGKEEEDPDSMRPTSYDNPVYDPDDEPLTPPPGTFLTDAGTESDNEIVKFFKDTYIGSPYDSRNRKQARFVVRSVTLISFAIGVVFTAVWYLFPGKFISYKADTDFTTRYQQAYMDPDQLLSVDQQLNPGVPFEPNLPKTFMDKANSIERFEIEKPTDSQNQLARPTMKL